MKRPPFRADSTYGRLMLAVLDIIDDGGDIPCMRPDSRPEWWFSDDERDIFRAKERCRVCPVQRLCGQHAAEAKEHGIWGASSRAERNLSLHGTVVVTVEVAAPQ